MSTGWSRVHSGGSRSGESLHTRDLEGEFCKRTYNFNKKLTHIVTVTSECEPDLSYISV